MPKDYHKILGVGPEASIEDIKAAYRTLAKKFHPDHNKSPDAHELFIEITEAYEVLSDPEIRRTYYHSRDTIDLESRRKAYEKARKAAREAAERYARMKYEKFTREQEAFKKSGWYDVVLLLHYAFRILVFPLIAFFILMPFFSEEVSAHPTGYVMFWILALIFIVYLVNNRKGYFKLGKFYYTFRRLRSLFISQQQEPTERCYYSKGQIADSLPYRVTMFKIKKIEMKPYGILYGPGGGMSRKIQTARVPRSRKALIIHSTLPFVKIVTTVLFVLFVRYAPIEDYAFYLGLLAGGALSSLILLFTRTRSKISYLLSYGMLIKLFVWAVVIYLAKSYALLMLFFDPFIEATLRYINEKLFRPLMRQPIELEILFRNDYQLYLELPVWSAVVPFFRWLF